MRSGVVPFACGLLARQGLVLPELMGHVRGGCPSTGPSDQAVEGDAGGQAREHASGVWAVRLTTARA